MESFLISLSTIALAEMGDRTQLLALVFAARYRKPWAIQAAVLCATLVSNVLAAFIGEHVAPYLTPRLLDTLVGVSMIAMGLWALKPDKEPEQHGEAGNHGAFVATFIGFLIAELGDKTQLATLALAAAYSNLLMVVLGSTVGMMLANSPAILLGHTFASRLPLRIINAAASLLFIGVGAVYLWSAFFRH